MSNDVQSDPVARNLALGCGLFILVSVAWVPITFIIVMELLNLVLSALPNPHVMFVTTPAQQAAFSIATLVFFVLVLSPLFVIFRYRRNVKPSSPDAP